MSKKKLLIIGMAIIVVATWIGVIAGFALDVTQATLIKLVTAAAIATEGAFWLGAAMFGLSVFQARKTVWQKITAVFRRGNDSTQVQ